MNASLRRSRVLLGLVPVCLAACAGGSALRLQDVTPESVAGLQAQHEQQPADQNVATRLGVAYFRASQFPQARAILDTVTTEQPANGIAAIYRGMTAEQQGDFAAARDSYDHFIQVGHSSELKNTARQRLALVGRRELEFQARQALAQESQLSQTPPEPNTIAVMPFAYGGSNADIQPLSRGFAQLVVTDLAKSRQVRVLERERMQAMLDEMRLGEQSRTDPQTATRSGRLLRAANVVQGSLQDEGNILRVDATVVNVNTAEVGANPARAAEQLSRIFDIEKVLVRQLFTNMGITLTDAERAAIDQRPTENLAAFLAWSKGLSAEDRGDFAAAQGFFNEAVRLDPGFGAAAASAQNSADLQAASTQSVTTVEASVATSATQETSVSAPPSSEALANATNSVTPNNTPTSGQGSTSTENPQQPRTDAPPPPVTPTIQPPTATIRIVIPRP